MRKPRDYDSELKALEDRARQLKDRRIRQLGELVIATGADALTGEQLAGALLAAMNTNDGATREAWTRAATPPAPEIPANAAPPAPKRDLFAGIKLNIAPVVAPPAASPLDKAVERFARAAADVSKMRRAGLDVLPHQNIAHREARQALDAIRPEGGRDLVSAFTRDRSVLDEAVAGRPAAAIRAMQFEAEIRTGLDSKADRFIDDWQAGIRRYRMLQRTGDSDAAWQSGERLSAMAKSLERDPQVESLLRHRTKELGLTVAQGQSLSQSLQRSLDLSRSRGIGL